MSSNQRTFRIINLENEILHKQLKRAVKEADDQAAKLSLALEEIGDLSIMVNNLTEKIKNVTGCDISTCCMYVHFETCDKILKCYHCPCCEAVV